LVEAIMENKKWEVKMEEHEPEERPGIVWEKVGMDKDGVHEILGVKVGRTIPYESEESPFVADNIFDRMGVGGKFNSDMNKFFVTYTDMLSGKLSKASKEKNVLSRLNTMFKDMINTAYNGNKFIYRLYGYDEEIITMAIANYFGTEQMTSELMITDREIDYVRYAETLKAKIDIYFGQIVYIEKEKIARKVKDMKPNGNIKISAFANPDDVVPINTDYIQKRLNGDGILLQQRRKIYLSSYKNSGLKTGLFA